MTHFVICFEPLKNRCYLEYEGPLLYNEIKEATLAVIDHPEFKKSMDMLFEIKTKDIAGDVSDAIKFGDFQDAVSERRGYAYRAAVVFYNEELFSYMCDLVAYAKSTENELSVFKTKEEAVAWLDKTE